ncbi:glycoside hydrolase superfamily [Gongronella butleri]|nr:glycoside hydrolase superfamily [Gongronella butleri]
MKLQVISILLACTLISVQAHPLKRDNDNSTVHITPLSWDDAYKKATPVVDKLSLQDMINIVTGNGGKGPCVGNSYEVKGVLPAICYQDAGIAMRSTTGITVGVSGVNAAASFDKKALQQRGEYLGEEFRGKGANVILGPMMNMARTPESGRNFEGFGEDPYLSGVATQITVEGIQSKGVMANAKHLIGNEQETFRNLESSEIGDKALNEVYLWPFERAIESGVASVMCSYNKLNGTYACENDYILRKIVKDRLDFKGFIVSDWGATHDTVQSANNGLDVNMPGPNEYGNTLLKAVNDGKVKKETLRDMALRVVAAWYKLKQDENFPATNFNAVDKSKDQKVDVQGNHKVYVRQMGAASAVLLKNDNQTLPLQAETLKSIAVIGTDAQNSLILGDNLCGTLPCLTGTVAQGGGSASATYPYLVTPLDGIKSRVGKDTEVHAVDSDINILGIDSGAAKKSEVAVVFSNVFTMEAFDRTNINLDRNGNSLIKKVADANKNTIVVIHSPNAVLMPWIDHPNVKAVIWAGYPGQETGNSLADVLFGDVNPSGRLPITIAKNEKDYPAKAEFSLKVQYDEGVYGGYRWFDQHNIEPLFPFGHGLSYTSFSYADLKVVNANGAENEDSERGEEKHASSSSTDILIEASVTVRNTGDRDGAEVVQAYIGFPAAAQEPPKLLRGFEKVFIKKGASATVKLAFNRRELSVWAANGWQVTPGKYTLYIGASSRDIRQTGSFTL